MDFLYEKGAMYYDLVYSSKDYKKEVSRVLGLISKYKKSKGEDLLDVACGTGEHLKYLENIFCCHGIDSSKHLLCIAKRKLKNTKLKKLNMIDFKLSRKFDVITCLFSSISYIKNKVELNKTLENFSRRLKKGGVMIIEPFFTMQNARKFATHSRYYKNNKTAIEIFFKIKIAGKFLKIDETILITEEDGLTKTICESVKMRIFNKREYFEIMKKLGLKVFCLKNAIMDNRDVVIGIKQ